MSVEEVIPPKLTGSRTLQQNLFTLLQSCNSIRKLTQIHAHIIINGFIQKNFMLVKLLSFYITSGYLQSGLNVFQSIERPSTTVWNQIIRGHALTGKPQKSVEFYKQMLKAEAKPDGFTYSFLLCACAKWGLLREGEQVHGKVFVSGHCLNVFVQTNLVNLYAMSGGSHNVEYARNMFDEMSERNVVSWNSLLAGYIRYGDIFKARQIFDEMPDRNVISWTAMIAGLARNGGCKEALSLFYQMKKACVELDQVVLIATLSACAELGDLKLGRWIHRYIDKVLRVRQQQVLVSLYNALIHMYASCGVIEEAYRIFREMPERTTVSWTSIISGLAKQGFAEEALYIFQEMLSLGGKETRPDEITFIAALCACSHAGFIDEGRRLFKLMTRLGIKPRIEHYGCIIDLLGRAGFLQEAQQLIESMPMKPSDAVWGALLGGCRLHKNVMLASDVAQKLLAELDHKQAAGYLVLLSNVYAAAKSWIDVASVRQKMVQMNVRKPAGRSWIQINGTMHDFVAVDMTHKHASSIYEALNQITREAKREGYKLDESVMFSCVQ